MEFNGTIHKICETVQVNATFKKRDVVLTIVNTGKDGVDYPEFISFQFVQDKCDLLNEKKEGDAVQILFNLKGRKWISPQGEEKYFNTLDAWQIHSDPMAQLPDLKPQPTQAAPAQQAQAAPNPSTTYQNESEDEVPF